MFENCKECDNKGCIGKADCEGNTFRTIDEKKCVSFCQTYEKG